LLSKNQTFTNIFATFFCLLENISLFNYSISPFWVANLVPKLAQPPWESINT